MLIFTLQREFTMVNIDQTKRARKQKQRIKLQSRKFEWNHFDSNSAKRVQIKGKNYNVIPGSVSIFVICVCMRAGCYFFFTRFHMENKRKMWHQTCVWMTPTTKHKQHTFSLVREQKNEWVNKTDKKKSRQDSAKNTTSTRFVFQVE